MSFICLSPPAWEKVAQSTTPRFYFDLARARSAYTSGQTPFTPAISLVRGLDKALIKIKEEGMESVWQRHAALAGAVQKAVAALGLNVLAQNPCHVLTAVLMPEGIDADRVTRDLVEDYGVRVPLGFVGA